MECYHSPSRTSTFVDFAVSFLGNRYAASKNPDHIREESAESGDKQLAQALDALEDDGILEVFEQLKRDASKNPTICKIID